MPYSILDYKSHFLLLYPNKPPFGLTFRVFGCVAFIHYLGLGWDKLLACSVKYIFLKYSRTQKGYQYYDPVSHRYYVSVDATFFESLSFFFASRHTLS